MDSFTLFSTAFLIGLSGAMMPGPMLTVTISETPRRGIWVGPQMVFGHGIVELILVVCLAGGLSYYIQQPLITGGIGLVGGLVLLWFVRGIYQSAANHTVCLNLSAGGDELNKPQERPSLHPVMAGILLSITNPYWSLWWATVGISYVVVAMNAGAAGIATFFLGHILADFAWYALVSFVIYSGRSYISDRIYRAILIICAVFLVVLGCWFAYDGYQKLSLFFIR